MAHAIQNNARKYIEAELQPLPELFHDITMYWADANFISDKQHGKVIIEKIDKKARNVTFKDELEKSKCTTRHANYPKIEWQDLIYRVDVKAIYINDKLKGYEVLKVYDGVLPLNE